MVRNCICIDKNSLYFDSIKRIANDLILFYGVYVVANIDFTNRQLKYKYENTWEVI